MLEGSWPGHLVMIEFPSLDHARGWYRSPAYQAIVRLRTNHSAGECILIEGVAADHRATDVLAGQTAR